MSKARAHKTSAFGFPFEDRPSGSILKNCRMWGSVFLVLVVFGSSPVRPAQAQSGPPGSGWTLTFDDEFSGNALDLNKWEPSTWQGSPASKFDPSAVVEGNGVLQILTYLTDPNGPVTSSNTTSGQIDTLHTFTQTYGWFEFRCKMAPGAGMDEATWMFGAALEYQEIDMPEWLGNRPNTLHLAHLWSPPGVQSYSATSSSMVTPTGPDWSADFHTYAINWQPDSLTYYVDGIQYWQTMDTVPQVPMYLLVGSGANSSAWGGDINASTCPNSMVLKYVRVYQGRGTTPPIPPPPPPPPSSSSVIYPGQGGSLATSEGTWTFGPLVGGVDYATQLDGVTKGWGCQLQITNGSVYVLNNATGHWFLWQNDAWVDEGTTAPVGGTTPPIPPPPPPPPSSSSVIYPGQGGSLATSEGTWTFGPLVGGVDYATQLNGVTKGWGCQLQITNGSVYVLNNATGHWFLWQNDAWVDVGTTAP